MQAGLAAFASRYELDECAAELVDERESIGLGRRAICSSASARRRR